MTADGMDGLERFDSPGKGRGLRVNRAYRVGELLFVCPAFSHVLSVTERGYSCEHCFARTGTGEESVRRCESEELGHGRFWMLTLESVVRPDYCIAEAALL
ncbi:N-lysine methyltransferase SMYD2-B [Bagarius yarrelli]|uniref:N-lysine methyltransferase SMYD2-B n=1 Tax=Bagarius yarrelli TaxID=175774 RepID=A0A556TZC2_BAGYA|nr:N-lysine methyltransferase SMYD2-B [Bagarius yarrelli]